MTFGNVDRHVTQLLQISLKPLLSTCWQWKSWWKFTWKFKGTILYVQTWVYSLQKLHMGEKGSLKRSNLSLTTITKWNCAAHSNSSSNKCRPIYVHIYFSSPYTKKFRVRNVSQNASSSVNGSFHEQWGCEQERKLSVNGELYKSHSSLFRN